MKNGFVKVAAASPNLRVADPAYNVKELIRLAIAAHESGAQLMVFPRLCLTGATCGDLFFSQALQEGALNALSQYLKATASLDMISAVGLPISQGNRVYDCAALCLHGKVLGILPKTYASRQNAGASSHHFAPAPEKNTTLCLFDEEIPFGARLLFTCRELPSWKMGIEIGEDRSAILPPSLFHAAAGATIICAPASDPETAGQAERRIGQIRALSSQAVAGYILSCAGCGESTTDMVFGGHQLICENGELLAELPPLQKDGELCMSEIDTQRLLAMRQREDSCPDSACEGYREIFFSLPVTLTPLTRPIAPNPFVPKDPALRRNLCKTVLSIQIEGLRQRLERAYAKKAVIGISGGLDSTLALLVAAGAMDALGRSHKDILAVTMPCFGTTERTKSNATVLCEELGTDFRCVNIFDAVKQHFADIGHNPDLRDVTYENAQARERTQVLMDLANEYGGMVIGTGDLSELALGWATYNGDHMSMYGVNASLPKTLIRHVVASCAQEYEESGKHKVAAALRDILDTPVSPELLPADGEGNIAQRTEDLVGPYEIHDFYLYYLLRFGYSPAKLYRLAQYALGDTYSSEVLLKWLKVLVRRFFTQQFKRSCLPDGPATGAVSLSPRTGWSMPSDASAALWIAEAEAL